jgi:T-complex protein 1 subunit eta
MISIGFEQQPKEFKSPSIVLLNVELELKSERHNAEVRIKDPREYQSIVDAEWTIIYDKLKAIVASGAKIVLSKLPIGISLVYFVHVMDGTFVCLSYRHVSVCVALHR